MANEDFERTGREAPIDEVMGEDDEHRDLAVLALRALARKHDAERAERARELRSLDEALGVNDEPKRGH